MKLNHSMTARKLWQVAVLAGGSLAASMAMAAPAGTPRAGGPGQGALMTTEQLPAASRAAVLAWVNEAKVSNPQAFEAVADVTGCTAAGYVGRRNPKPGCSTELRALGKDAVPAMVAALVLAEPKSSSGHVPYQTAEEKEAFVGAALESIGYLREHRGSAVLQAALQVAPAAHWQQIAGALGKLGGDRELRVLTDVVNSQDPRNLAAIFGLGECMRVESARLLAAKLRAQPNARVAAELAEALGRVASAWGWQALANQAPDDARRRDVQAQALEIQGITVREAASALAFYSDKQTVDSLRHAVMMAEHPETATILAVARRTADAAGQARIDAVAARYAAHLKRR